MFARNRGRHRCQANAWTARCANVPGQVPQLRRKQGLHRISIDGPGRVSVQRESILSAPPAAIAQQASPWSRSTQDRFLNVFGNLTSTTRWCGYENTLQFRICAAGLGDFRRLLLGPTGHTRAPPTPRTPPCPASPTRSPQRRSRRFGFPRGSIACYRWGRRCRGRYLRPGVRSSRLEEPDGRSSAHPSSSSRRSAGGNPACVGRHGVAVAPRRN